MKNMKSIFLGSALAVAAATGAHAADAILTDVKAPREPVYRCDITGFIELPGTDICFKVGGYARLVAAVQSNNVGTTEGGVLPYTIVPEWDPTQPLNTLTEGENTADTFWMYGQARVNFDARTVTEYGTVRGFIEVQASDNDSNTSGSLNLRHAYVQFGNWTFGKTWSTFLHLASSPDASDPFTLVGDNFIRRNQIRYTQSFGQGVSLSVAIEDPNYNRPTFDTANGVYTPVFLPGGALVNDSNSLPDVVAALNVSGNWGEAQISGALHQNNFSSYYGTTPPFASFNDSELGWAILGGLVINTPMTGEGDAITLKAVYTDGASQYMGGNTGYQYFQSGTTNVIWGNCAFPGYNECITDTVTSWSVLGSFTHGWTSTVSTTIGAGYQNTQAEQRLAQLR